MIIKEKDYLAHSGVMGMKWGNHKKGEPITKNSTSNKSPMEDDHDLVIKKGTVIKRMSDSKELGSTKNRTHIYAAHTKADIDAYTVFLEMKYEISFKVKDNLVSPSKKKRVDTFVEEFSKSPKIAQAMAKSKKDNSPFAIRSQDTYAKAYLKMSENKLREKGYLAFQASLVDSKSNRDTFFNKLESKGYNMVIDDNDVKNGISKSPLLIFNAGKTLDRTGHKVITEAASDAASQRDMQRTRDEMFKSFKK